MRGRYLSADDGVRSEQRVEGRHGRRLRHAVRKRLCIARYLLGYFMATDDSQWRLHRAEVQDEQRRVAEVFFNLA